MGGRGRGKAARVLKSSASDAETPMVQLFEALVDKWSVSEKCEIFYSL